MKKYHWYLVSFFLLSLFSFFRWASRDRKASVSAVYSLESYVWHFSIRNAFVSKWLILLSTLFRLPQHAHTHARPQRMSHTDRLVLPYCLNHMWAKINWCAHFLLFIIQRVNRNMRVQAITSCPLLQSCPADSFCRGGWGEMNPWVSYSTHYILATVRFNCHVTILSGTAYDFSKNLKKRNSLEKW